VDPLPLIYLALPRLPPEISFLKKKNCPGESPPLPFFERGGLLVENTNSLLFDPIIYP